MLVKGATGRRIIWCMLRQSEMYSHKLDHHISIVGFYSWQETNLIWCSLRHLEWIKYPNGVRNVGNGTHNQIISNYPSMSLNKCFMVKKARIFSRLMKTKHSLSPFRPFPCHRGNINFADDEQASIASEGYACIESIKKLLGHWW